MAARAGRGPARRRARARRSPCRRSSSPTRSTRSARSRAEVVARVRAAGDLRIVGVTGSNGKTTTKNLLRADPRARRPDGRAHGPRSTTRWARPITMLELADDTRFLVAEMGASAVGEIARLVRMARARRRHRAQGGPRPRRRVRRHRADRAGEVRDGHRPARHGCRGAQRRRPARRADGRPRPPARVVWFGLGRRRRRARGRRRRRTARGTDFTVQLATGESAPRALRRPRRAPRHERPRGHRGVDRARRAAAGRRRGARDGHARRALAHAAAWAARDGITVINDAYNASPDSMAAALQDARADRRPRARARSPCSAR